MNKTFFEDSNLVFKVLTEGLTEKQINNIVSLDFNGKEHFIQFYLSQNGIYFPEGAEISRSQFYKIDNEEYDELEIEFIYDIENIKKMWEAMKEHSEKAKTFAETHIPFAGDAAGNEFFIEIPTGFIKYIAWEYDLPEGVFVVAPNFRAFCSAIRTLNY